MPIDYKNYCKDWKKRSLFIRTYRAKNKCEFCGCQNKEPHPITGSKVVLTVAHLDRNRDNNSFFNLAALCQRCHLNHDKWQHVSNRKYGREHKGEHQLKMF